MSLDLSLTTQRLINGDALYALDELIKNNVKVDLIYIDPPYDFESGGKNNSGLNGRMNRLHHVETNNMRNGFDYQAYAERFKKLQNKTNIYIWCSKNQIRELLNMFPNLDPYILFWGKTNPIPAFNGTYLSNVEYILHFREKGATKMNTTYKTASRFDIQSLNQKDKKLYDHPTVKPINIVKRHIEISTNPGQTVLDCFAGTGTTGVAAKELGRNFIGVEYDEKYFNTAQKRIKEATNGNQKTLWTKESE